MTRSLAAWLRSFFHPPRQERLDLKRRSLLFAGVTGAASVSVARIGAIEGQQSFSPALVRPPGALDEPAFLSRCIRCGECMRVCPTHAIQPASDEGGWTGLWTPVLKMRTGYCDFECNLCSKVCPTQAIAPLALVAKQKLHIGTAFFDRNRCLPYAAARSCIVCEEHCPTPKKAIFFDEVSVATHDGGRVTVKQPRVDQDLCIGCGVCENKCPIADQRGVTVSSVGETRHPKNQILLTGGGGGLGY